MNGVINAILSVLLGWLRTLFNSVWQLLGSEGGSSFYTFLRNNWKLLAIVLIVGGFVLDRMVFFARWRPDLVWRTKLGRLRKGSPERGAERQAPARRGAPDELNDAYRRPVSEPDAFDQPADLSAEPYDNTYYDEAREPFAADANAYQPFRQPSAVPDEPLTLETNVYTPVAYGQPVAAETHVYAPVYQDAPASTFAPPASYARAYTPPVSVDLMTEDARYDDEPIDWQPADNPLFSPRVAPLTQNPAQGMTPRFGAAQPEPTAYLQDVQAGFAPPPTPEELYRRRSMPLLRDLPEDAPAAPVEPVHPGLDPAVLQQNIGLTGNEQLTNGRQSDAFADFTPFTAPTGDAESAKPAGPLSQLAKRARSLVGGIDDEELSIRDLQSTVDVKSAFHSPVYPKKKPESEDE